VHLAQSKVALQNSTVKPFS